MFDPNTANFPFPTAAEESTVIETEVEADKPKRTRTKQPPIPVETYHYVLENYSSETSEDIASKFGINPNQVNRIVNTIKKDLRNKVEGASEEAKAEVEKFISEKLTRARKGSTKAGSSRSMFKENIAESVNNVLSMLNIK